MSPRTIFTITPGVPFLKTFVDALLDGRIVAGFSRALPPLGMADATIYVPTRRAARSLIDEFASALDRPATLLPRILPLGALDATETALLFEEPGLEAPLAEDLPQAASEIWRRMQLARLIFHWAQNLRHAIISIDRDGNKTLDPREPCLVGTSSLDAFALAGDLADLIDELIIEDIAFAALDPLALPEFDHYWRITLDFLNIATAYWPQILAENHLVDAARRRVLTVERQIARIEAGHMGGPVIAIGSTGTNQATARLLAAIARAPQGAIVLPGLDRDLDAAAWQQVGANADDAQDAAFGHPQAALARLLTSLKVARDSVIELGQPDAARAARTRFVSEALRPAKTTEHWQIYRGATDAAEITASLEQVALIEAGDEREEALALAIAMRQILEEPERTAALVTPDRDLARRVTAELTRFGIDVEDSAGEPLSASPYGILARLVAQCAASGYAAEDVVALLAHPLTRLGFAHAQMERLAPLFEIGVLRQDRAFTTFPTVQDAIAAARRKASDRFAHPAQKRITEADWSSLESLLGALKAALASLCALDRTHDLRAWIEAHRRALDLVTQSEDAIPLGEDYEVLQALFDELARCALPDLGFTAESYLLFFAQMAGATTLRRQRRTHPRLKIFGLLEARLMEADLMLLGGLDETIWPPETRTDAFLNRPMRAALGLSPPERKIGQTAHDFAAAMGAERVILSRAQKRDGAPMVASRFVQRLAAVGGSAFEACRQRGQIYLDLARALDRPRESTAAAKRPMPRPALGLRPTRLSVTRIETLRRDPYAIYAEFILGLIALPSLSTSADRRIMGMAIHDVLAHFCETYPSGALPEQAPAYLTTMLRAAFAEEFSDPEFAAFDWPRIEAAATFYLGFEARRRDALTKIHVEIDGKLAIPLADGSVFTLSAKADRLEHRDDGTISLIDYKTGAPPGANEVLVGFAPQLTLEAAMAKRGAFGLASGASVGEALYVKLFGKGGGEEKPLRFKPKGQDKDTPPLTIAEVAENHFEALIALLNQFRDESTPYPPRPFPKFSAKYNAYDHLARVKEWSLGSDEGGDA
ncbi:MAG: double-strand break repair protein AddB [Methylovirgula sp.]